MKKIFIFCILLISFGLFAGTPHNAIAVVQNSDGSAPVSVTFQAENLSNPGEILNEYSGGCAYYPTGQIQVNCGTFPTQWDPGETVHLDIQNPNNGETGSCDVVLTTAGFDYFLPNPCFLVASGPAPIDWVTVTGTVDVGVPSAPGIGYGNGLPNEDLLANPANVGLFFTLTIDDDAPVAVTICLDLDALGYVPLNLAYWVNGGWIYEPSTGPLVWSGDCVTFTLDPTVTDKGGKPNGRISKDGNTRADVDVYIVFSGEDNPLPVYLSSFYATYIGGTPIISWVTQSETDNIGWNVYRSCSQNFGQAQILNLNTIPGNGTTSEPSFYSFTDEYEVYEGFTYSYWLESISGDGETESFGPISLTIPFEGNEIPEIPMVTELHQNFPNPFNPNTLISFDIKENETGVLSIYNIKGQLIVTDEFGEGIHSYTWDARDHSSGVYLYKLQVGEYSKTMKMLLVK